MKIGPKRGGETEVWMNMFKWLAVSIFFCLGFLATQPVAAGLSPAPGEPTFWYPVSREVGEGVSYTVESEKHQNADAFAIDFLAPGQNDQKDYGVYPTLPGRVVYAGCGSKFYGCAVALQHADGTKWRRIYYSIYAHLKEGSLTVKVGDEVTIGNRLGWMGKSGKGGNGIVHLHFAVRSSPALYSGLLALYGQYLGANEELFILTPAEEVKLTLWRPISPPNWSRNRE